MTLKTDTTSNIVPSPGNDHTPRRLYIDFDLYTEGDQEFKKDLCALIIDNIKEFQQSLTDSVRQKDPQVFLKASHKVKVTLGMLDDQEFYNLVRELEISIMNRSSESHVTTLSRQFQNICNVIVISLVTEINS